MRSTYLPADYTLIAYTVLISFSLYHIYETDETLFMALEWLEGGCLWNHIARMGTMPECYAIYYGSCILTALRYLHSQCIVYR